MKFPHLVLGQILNRMSEKHWLRLLNSREGADLVNVIFLDKQLQPKAILIRGNDSPRPPWSFLIWQGPFLSLPMTQRDTVSGTLCFMCFSHPGPCCLLPPTRKVASSNLSPSSHKPPWPFLGWFWSEAEDLKDPSIHQSLTDHCRTKQERFWGTSDPWDVWEQIKHSVWLTCPFIRSLPSPTSLFLKLRNYTTSLVTEALPRIIKAGN